MEQKKDKHLSKRSGFTLIEIILVVVIIGILSGIFLKGLHIGGKTEQAKMVAAHTDIEMLAGAVDMYEMSNGEYPATLEGLLDTSKQGYPFLRKNNIPDDPWGNPYQYSVPGAHGNSYDISASGREDTVNSWD